jgi:hypothetical protein
MSLNYRIRKNKNLGIKSQDSYSCLKIRLSKKLINDYKEKEREKENQNIYNNNHHKNSVFNLKILSEEEINSQRRNLINQYNLNFNEYENHKNEKQISKEVK